MCTIYRALEIMTLRHCAPLMLVLQAVKPYIVHSIDDQT